MTSNQQKVLIFLFACSVFASCKKDDDTETTIPSGYASLQEFYDKYAVKSQFFNINNNTQQVISGTQGSTVTFPAASLIHSNGQPATGNVRVELKEIYKKSDMMYADIPTMTATGPLKSGGEIFIRAIEEASGELLQVANNAQIEIFMPDTAASDTMTVFIQAVSPDSLFNGFTWIPAQGPGWSASLFTTPSGYQISTDTLTWINCDQPIFSNPWLELNLHATDDVIEYHTDVFIFFPQKTMIHVYGNGSATNSFMNTYTPVNSSMTVVAIGLKNGKLQSSIVPVTVASSDLTVNFTMQETTEAALTAAINALN